MKANRNNVKTYQLNSSGKFDLVEDNLLSEFENYQVYDEKTVNKEVLYTNPFLFNIEKSNGCYVSSIEDFYLQDKNQTYNMGLVLRSGELRKGTRNKIVKKNFKRWKKEIKDRLNFVFRNANNKINEANSTKVIGVHFINKLLLLISMVICVLLLTNVIKVINPLNKVLKIITIIVFSISMIGLILSTIQDCRNHSYKNSIKVHKSKMNKYEKEVEKAFKNKYSKAYKYYKKGMRKQIFNNAPLTMDQIVIGGDKIDYIEKSTIIVNDKYMKNIIKKDGFYLTYQVPIILSYVLSILSGGYLIVELIIALIKHIMKGE